MEAELTSVPRALEDAHKRAVTTDPAEQATFVQEVLGSRLAAAALGLKDTRTLSSWASGGPVRGVDGAHRLQVLFRVVTAITSVYSPAVAAAFLRGSNPYLSGQAPLLLLADEPPTQTERKLVDAVEAFLLA